MTPFYDRLSVTRTPMLLFLVMGRVRLPFKNVSTAACLHHDMLVIVAVRVET